MRETGDAVMALTRLGFRLRLEGEDVKVWFEGSQAPDSAMVSPLLALLRDKKEEVLFFLKCYCPRCGGVAFCPDLQGKNRCLACDREYLTSIYPGLDWTAKQDGSG